MERTRSEDNQKASSVLLEDDLGIYTAHDLCARLIPVRGRAVPLRTLKYWREQIGIRPDSNRLYSKNDLKILKSLVRWIGRGGKIQTFLRNLERKQNAN